MTPVAYLVTSTSDPDLRAAVLPDGRKYLVQDDLVFTPLFTAKQLDVIQPLIEFLPEI